MRYFFFLVTCFICINAFSQKPGYSWYKQSFSSKVSFESALIIVDGKKLTYEEALNIADSNILSVQVHEPKYAKKLYSDEGKKGAFVVKTMHREKIKFPLFYTKDSACYYVDGTDTVFTTLPNNAEIVAKDSSFLVEWKRFLMKKLDPNVAIENGAPAGYYSVMVRFLVSAEGKVYNVKYEADPGYGTGAEAVRVVSKFGYWKPAIYNGRPVNSIYIQPVRFVVSE